MCLDLRTIDHDKPYDDKKIRYKWLRRHEDGTLTSIFVTAQAWAERVWNEAKPMLHPFDGNHSISALDKDHGFHVYVHAEQAEAQFFLYRCYDSVLVAVEVEGFIASGSTPYDSNLKSETWRKAKIIKICA